MLSPGGGPQGEVFFLGEATGAIHRFEIHTEILARADHGSMVGESWRPDWDGKDFEVPKLDLGEVLVRYRSPWWDLDAGKIHTPRGISEVLHPIEFLQPRDLTFPFGPVRYLAVPGLVWSWERGQFRGWASLVRADSPRYSSPGSRWAPWGSGDPAIELEKFPWDSRTQMALSFGSTAGPVDWTIPWGQGVSLYLQGPVSGHVPFLHHRMDLAGVTLVWVTGPYAVRLESAGRWFNHPGLENYAVTVVGLERSLYPGFSHREFRLAVEAIREDHLEGGSTPDFIRVLDPLRPFQKAIFLTMTTRDLNSWDGRWSLGVDADHGWTSDLTFLYRFHPDLHVELQWVTLDAPEDHPLRIFSDHDVLRITARVYLH